MQRKLSFSDKNTIIFLFCMGMYIFVRGLVWDMNQQSVINDSEFYLKLHEVMPIWIWGIFIMIFGVCLMVASVFYSSQKVNNISSVLITIGGFGACFIHTLMASAALFNALNMITPLQFMILSLMFGAIGFIGGADIARKRR